MMAVTPTVDDGTACCVPLRARGVPSPTGGRCGYLKVGEWVDCANRWASRSARGADSSTVFVDVGVVIVVDRGEVIGVLEERSQLVGQPV